MQCRTMDGHILRKRKVGRPYLKLHAHSPSLAIANTDHCVSRPGLYGSAACFLPHSTPGRLPLGSDAMLIIAADVIESTPWAR